MSSLDKNKKSSSSKKRALKTKTESIQTTPCTTPQLSTISCQKKEPTIPSNEQINLNNLFQQALARYKKDTLTDKKDKLKEINHLALMAEEYLSTFALIGYSLQNEKVVVFNVSNSKDEAALVDLLRSTFLEIINNRP